MHRLQVLICRVDDQHPDEKTQIAAFDLPTLDVTTLQPETFLDELEASTQVIGHDILRRTLQARWEMVDATLAVQYAAGHALEEVQADGYAPVTVASRFGVVSLCRQVLVHSATNTHVVPGNAVLPAHEGRITTRGLQEWACTLAQDLPFVTVARLLGWQTQEEQILSDMTIRRLVRQHGQLIAQAEQAEITSLLEHEEDPAARPQLVALTRPRRRAGWPAALSAAVDAALAHEEPRPPEGVSWADWQRVLTARRAEATLPTEQLRLLRPQLEPGQILLTVDDVFARSQEKRHFVALHTAHMITAAGQRYLCGTGDMFLQKVLLLARLCLGTERSLLLIADGARWIRSFFQEQLAALPQATMLLDW